MNLIEFKRDNYQDFYTQVEAMPASPMTDNAPDYFGYVSNATKDISSVMELIDLENPKIVDLGAGFCEMLLFLKSFFPSCEAHAVEFNSNYVSDVSPLLVDLGITMHESNILSHDISEYDFIHTFCPARSADKYIELNEYIRDNMKVGAYWLETHPFEAEPSDINSPTKLVYFLSENDFDIIYNEGNLLLTRKK